MCFLDVRGKPEHDIEEKETEYDCKEKKAEHDSNKRKSEDDRKTKPRSQNGAFYLCSQPP